MFFEPIKTVQMNSSGRSLLQSLQDITTPVLDLIVREAIQNSTDAVKCGVEKVIVDFSLGNFKSKIIDFEASIAIIHKRSIPWFSPWDN